MLRQRTSKLDELVILRFLVPGTISNPFRARATIASEVILNEGCHEVKYNLRFVSGSRRQLIILSKSAESLSGVIGISKEFSSFEILN